jgi:hypothetical protein
MHAENGAQRLMQWSKEPSLNQLYVVNRYGKKLLKLVVGDQKSSAGVAPNAQIKLIHYGLRRAVVWEDEPSDPKVLALSRTKSFESTYHGPGPQGQAPRIHVLEYSAGCKRYVDLLDSVLALKHDLQQMVPMFSLVPGFDSDGDTHDRGEVGRRAHNFQVGASGFVQLDFYLSSADADPERLFNTHYGMALLFSFAHLSRKQRGILMPAEILMPITGHTMGKYCIWVRCIRSKHRGRPFIEFLRNHDYYEKFANRPTAWRGVDGKIHWSTISEEVMEHDLQSGLVPSGGKQR